MTVERLPKHPDLRSAIRSMPDTPERAEALKTMLAVEDEQEEEDVAIKAIKAIDLPIIDRIADPYLRQIARAAINAVDEHRARLK